MISEEVGGGVNPSLEGCWQGRTSKPPVAQRAGGIRNFGSSYSSISQDTLGTRHHGEITAEAL